MTGSVPMEPQVIAAAVQAIGTVVGALIVGVAGAIIGRRFARERDRQDKESQWRQHAIELTKLDLERKLKSFDPKAGASIRPSILDFLANYRDLQELGEQSPRELYERIQRDRTASRSAPAPVQDQAQDPQRRGA